MIDRSAVVSQGADFSSLTGVVMEIFAYSGIATAYMGFIMVFMFGKKNEWVGILGMAFGFAQIAYGVMAVS